MISFRRNLVTGEKVTDEKNIVCLLKKKIPVHGIFLICVSPDGKNFMELVPSTEIFKEIYRPKNFTVLGLAGGYLEAREVAAEILRKYIASERELSEFRKNLLIYG